MGYIMKKLSYLILTFLFLVTGALPLFAWTVIYPSNSSELKKVLCELKCHRQSETDEEYIACVTSCADKETADPQDDSDDSLQSITPEVSDYEELFEEELFEKLMEYFSDDISIEELVEKFREGLGDSEVESSEPQEENPQKLQQDMSETMCKLRCEVRYQKCLDNQHTTICLVERTECKEACESDEEEYSDYWYGIK